MYRIIIYKVKTSPFLYFLWKLIIVFLFVFVLDFITGTILKIIYNKQSSGLYYRTTFALEKTTADVLIFGSSRANHHYKPEIFQDSLKMSYYNVGRDGNFIFYHYAVLQSILKRYTPKIVVLDFVADEFIKGQDSYDRISALLPYYNTHPEIKQVVGLKSKYEKIKLLSKVYPYNSMLITMLVGTLEANKIRKTSNMGYVPLYKTWGDSIPVYKSEGDPFDIDSVKLQIFEMFIHDCKKANVKIYIVTSPYLYKGVETNYSVALGKEIANKQGVEFFNFSNHTAFASNLGLFADPGHLNDEGAAIFSKLVVGEIEK